MAEALVIPMDDPCYGSYIEFGLYGIVLIPVLLGYVDNSQLSYTIP